MCRWYAGGASSVELRDLQDVDNNAARLDRSERLPWHGRTDPRNDLQVKIRVAPSTVKLKKMSLPVQEGPILTICMVVVSWCRYNTTNLECRALTMSDHITYWGRLLQRFEAESRCLSYAIAMCS